MNLPNELQELIEGEVKTDEKTLEEYSTDYSIFKIKPSTVIFPKNTRDVERLVSYVTEKKKQGESVSLTARSAGTDMSGGPLNDSIIIEFTKYINSLREIGNDYAIVEPGLYYRDFEVELDKCGLLYPPYPASKDLCAMGGIVNNNSGGEGTLEYGKTEKYVEEVSVVLADGKEHTLKPLSGDLLKQKLQEQGFEGDLYRKLYKLLEDNYEDIQAAKPKVSKNSAGYGLWNVWDKKTFDIGQLIVGSQGTLGMMMSAKLRLVKKHIHSGLVVVFSNSLKPVPDFVKDILSLNPESIESYDDKTLRFAMRFFPSLLKLMKGSIITLFFKFLPEFLMVLKGGMPKMVLLVSFTSDNKNEVDENLKKTLEIAKNYPVQVHRIKDENEAQKYWTIRRQSFSLLHGHAKGMYAAAFIDDVIVDPKYMPEFLPKVNAILEEHKDKFIYTIAGHPGNGNFHIIPLIKLDDEETIKLLVPIMDKVYALVSQYNGSITAEHNDGLIRTPYLRGMYGDKIIGFFEEVKNIFDPEGIFNPHKKVGSTLEYAFKHLRSK